jgi:1-deoxy-D-xylulose-5-phosphate reductoisomerase
MSAGHRVGVAILGSTGSIGVSTLDVLSRHSDRFRVVALAAQSNVRALMEQCRVHRPQFAVLADESAAARLRTDLASEGITTEVFSGPSAIVEVAARADVEVVMAAIVGAAGLPAALAAARAGKRILLANKEALVMSGSLFIEAVSEGGAELIPIDSEHNAIFQCLPTGTKAGQRAPGVKRILLTASGGPFLRTSESALADVTPAQACAHPRWSMGRKISVDSATLMNKGLELIEASLLFDMPQDRIDVLVHPQSIVHSMVEYIDGSSLAQLGNPDMRVPIAHALGCPERLTSGVESLDLTAIGKLEFESPDEARFPCLGLARQAAQLGGTAPTALNAANEIAVNAFLSGRLRFTEIASTIARTLQAHRVRPLTTIETVMETDRWARDCALRDIEKNAAGASRVELC